jgi:hypothetical protein
MVCGRVLSLAVAGVLTLSGLAAIALSTPAGATTTSFTAQGCSAFIVPTGVTSISIDAIGAAGVDGEAIGGGTAGLGGAGDGVSATLTDLSAGLPLYVCVDVGGGAGGAGYNPGAGGGASGVSTGDDSAFNAPLLVAGGGGGGGAQIDSALGGNGGNAGSPIGGTGGTTEATIGGGGGDNTTLTGGIGGGGDDVGGNGLEYTDSGPGVGGVGATGSTEGGAGGGAGYFGGGGGGDGDGIGFGSGGGGGGSDYCGASVDLTDCTISSGAGTGTVAGSATGDAQVTLTYDVATSTEAVSIPATYSASAHNVTLSADVTAAGTVVNDGTVTFTVMQGATVIGAATTSSTVAAGAASVSYALPAATPPGSYVIDAVYNPGLIYEGSTDTAHTLDVVGPTTTAASDATASFSTSAQNVTLNATVTSLGVGVNSGTVTFTVMQGATVIGAATTSSTVTAGAASVSYALPAGATAGTYTIDASYNSGPSLFFSSDATHTLDIAAPASTAPTGVAQSTLALSTLTGTVGVPLQLATTGGSGIGAVTYTVANGTATGCAITGSLLAATTPGTCVVTAAKAASGTYDATSSSPTVVTVLPEIGTSVITPVPVRALRVVGRITSGKRTTVTIVGTGFYGSPHIVSNVSGFIAGVEHDRGTSLTVVITVKKQATRGVREMTLIMADGKRASVKYSLH